MAYDRKHLQKRHNQYWIYYRLPKRLLALPEFQNATTIYAKSLGTDSLKVAIMRRDAEILRLNKKADGDLWSQWQGAFDVEAEAAEVSQGMDADEYKAILAEVIEDQAGRQFGTDDDTGHPLGLTELQEAQLVALSGKAPEKTKFLKHLTAKLIEEYKANDKATKTTLKIRRASEWFLGHAGLKDGHIGAIEYDQVHEFVVRDQLNDVAGSTIVGYLNGLSQIWERAKKSKFVKGDNPFRGHKVSKDTQSYDVFTKEEIYLLYQEAEGELKTIIHAAATTGARMNEITTAEVLVPKAVSFPCWYFKFNEKGKTAQSTRIVPVHSSLHLEPGFTFKMTDRTCSRLFKALTDRIITDKLKEGSNKPRKLSFHSFRASVISELVGEHRIDRAIVGTISGHVSGEGSVGAINSYIHMDDLEEKQKIVELIKWDTGER